MNIPPDDELERRAERFVFKTTPQGPLELFSFRPKRTSAPTMAAVYFTGGGWKRGGPGAMLANAYWLAEHGAVGISADYRRGERHGTSPIEAVRDAKSAIRWVRAHAKELNIDPNRIVAAGGSAGGHLAACTILPGLDEPHEDASISSRGDALLLHNPVTGGPGFEPAFFAAHPEANPMLGIDARWPPTIASHGTADDVTPFADTVAFIDRIRSAGGIAELIAIDGAGHDCDWPATKPEFTRVMTRMTAFLRENRLLT